MATLEETVSEKVAEATIWTLEWSPGRRFVPAGVLAEITARNNALRGATDDDAARALLAQIPLIEAQIARFSLLALSDDPAHAEAYLNMVESCRRTLLAIHKGVANAH